MRTFLSQLFRRAPQRSSARTRSPLCLEVLEDRALLTAGILDPTFGTGGLVTTDFAQEDQFINNAGSVAVQSDGKIVLTGYSEYASVVVRYNSDGSLDNAFGTSGLVTLDFEYYPSSIAIQADGKIVVAGTSSSAGDFALARLNGDGSLDTSFNGDGKAFTDFGGGDTAYGVTLQSDGKIVVAGATSSSKGFALARYNSDGSLDTSFDSDGKVVFDFGGSNAIAKSVAFQADGKIIVSGLNQQASGQRDFAVARLNSDGSLDTSFDDDGKSIVNFGAQTREPFSLALQGDGKVVIVGYVYNELTKARVVVARLTANGSLDTSFDSDGKIIGLFGTLEEGARSSVVIQSDGKIVVAGTASNRSASANDFGVARLNSDGTPDATFNGDGKVIVDFGGGDAASGVTLQSDGKIVVVGYSQRLDTGTGFDLALARLYGDGEYAPVADAGGPYIVVRGGSVHVDASGTIDPNQANTTLTYAWDFDGDGQFDDASGIAPVFSAAGLETLGAQTVAVRVTDATGLTSTATTTIDVRAVAVIEDPLYTGQTALVVGGTLGDDHIQFTPGNSAGEIEVKLNSVLLGTFNPTSRLIAYGQDGNDDIQVANSINLPAWLYGGDGDDRLKGGGGNDVLLGGAGSDLVSGSQGRDLLIGGTGADRIVGNADDDILIAGSTAHDSDEAALAVLLATWTRTDLTYQQRVDALMAGVGTGGTIALNANTISDDSSVDVLSGNSGLDWFLFNQNNDGSVKDEVTDMSAFEALFAEDIDWLNSF